MAKSPGICQEYPSSDYPIYSSVGRLRSFSIPVFRFNDVLAPRRDLVTKATEAMRRIQQGEDSEQDQSTLEELTWTMVNATGKEREILKRAVVLGAQKVAQEGGKRGAGETFTGSAANLIDAMFGSRRRGESMAANLDPSKPLPVGPVASVEDALKAMNLMVQAQVSASRPYDPNAPTLPEPRQLSEDEQKLFTEAKAKAKELFKVDRELKKIALSTDPMDDSFLGTMASGTASSLALALPLALGPGGALLAAGGYANMEQEELLTEFPEMNPNDAAKIAVLSGGTQALLDKAQLAGLGRFAPNIRKMLTKGATKELVKRAVIEGAGTMAFENIVEAAQDLTTPVVQQLVSDLSTSVPGVDWEKESREFWGSRLDVAIGMMPLTLLGVGANTAMNKASALDLMANDKALAAAGVIETDRTTVLELARDGKAEEAQAALVDAWGRRSPELAAEMGSEQEAGIIQAQNAIQRAEESGLLPKLRRDGNGWAVENSETGAVVRVSNREEAVARVFGHLDEQEQRRAQAGAQLWDEIYDGGAETLKAEAGEMTTARLAGRSKQDAEWVRQGVQTFGELHGLTPDEAIQTAGAVLGFNRDETNEGVRSAVSSVFGRGMNVATVLHEATHGRWRAGLQSGRFTHEQGIAWVRMAEQATGIDFLPSKVDADISPDILDEAIVDVTVSDAIGRRKAGGRFSAGLISRGMAAMARGERAEAKQAGKLATWLKAWRDFWGVVLSKGRALNKARKEGKISDEFDAFLDDLMDTSPQARHELGAAKEAMEMVEAENAPFSLSPKAAGAVAPASSAVHGDGGRRAVDSGRGTGTDKRGGVDPQSRAIPSDTSNVTEMPDGARLVGPSSFSIRAYHGTPHKVYKFALDRIGTGEGAQAYGYGLYFAQSFTVADSYRGKLQKEFRIGFNGKTITELYPNNDEAAKLQSRLESVAGSTQYGSQGESVRKAFLGATYGDLLSKAPPSPSVVFARQVEKDYGNFIRTETGGNLYTVELLPDEADFLDWDKPLSEQSEKVKDALNKLSVNKRHPVYKATSGMLAHGGAKQIPGSDYYQAAVKALAGSAEEASKLLTELGIPGIKYLDGSSRGTGEGTSNHVIFDENLVKILEENGKPVTDSEMPSFSIAPSGAQFRFDGIAKEDPINDGSRVGTAWQGKVKPTTQDTNDGIATVDPKELAKQMGMLTHFIAEVPLPKYLTEFTDPTKKMREFIAFQKANLLALYDAFEKLSPDYVVRSTVNVTQDSL